jgi:putative alpha-1,2-mannosidase
MCCSQLAGREQSSVLFKFIITTRDNAPENKYIQFARLDGKPLEKPWFYHRELVDGGTLELQLGPKPNRTWGSRPVEAPPSMSQPADPG